MKNHPQLTLVGITGGAASGKSAVAMKLAELGAVTIDGDQLGHQVLTQPAVIAFAVRKWGRGVLDAAGQIDRAAVAGHVFAASPSAAAELADWEACVHPRITELLRSQLHAMSDQGEKMVVVLEASVIFKTGWDQWCDHLIFVDTPEKTRLARARQRSKWTPEQFYARESAQMPVQEKRARCTFVIDNADTLDKTHAQVVSFWKSLSR